MDLQVALWAIGIIFAGGIAYGDLRSGQNSLREGLKRMEKMIGNGHPGVFARRDELKSIKARSDDEHARLDRDMESMEERLRAVESRH